jgi:hypothetical protein
MILFELRCAQEHVFEAWFRDGATYDAQAAAGEIACPVCGGSKVEKAPMAPRLAKAHGSRLDDQEAAREVRRLLGEFKRKVETECENVGQRFPDEARKIHYGEAEKRSIYGEASSDDARELEEEGIVFSRIPWVNEGN